MIDTKYNVYSKQSRHHYRLRVAFGFTPECLAKLGQEGSLQIEPQLTSSQANEL